VAAEASLAGTAEKSPRQAARETDEALRSNPASEVKEDAGWKSVLGLPCDLTVDLCMPGFTIGDLLKLRNGSVINAHWRLGRDVPLLLNGTEIGLSEFEVVGDNLAVRLTELA
jgi:flagellar motor switch/type III secretory pathway protein FliN